jgi:AcrR family transcriptional regulator
MTRLAADRDTHLTPEEIAAEALRQFDENEREPSIRSLAAALHVAPTAIYHHFYSQAAIYQAAVELVWAEATAELLRLVPRPLDADAPDVLIAAGLATRRAWLAHHRVARYMAATPEANEFIGTTLGLMATLFERLGLEGEEAAIGFHSYASFMLGAVLFAADRKAANEQLAHRAGFHTPYPSDAQRRSSKRTRVSLDEVMELSIVDPAHDEELFELGLRRLIDSFVTRAASARARRPTRRAT